MEGVSIKNLSTEVIEQILLSEELSITDVVNFKKTCKQFEQAEMSNKFWHKKFVRNWPRLYEMYASEGSIIGEVKDWLDEVKFTSTIRLKTENFVREMVMSCFVQRFLSPEDIVECTNLWDPKIHPKAPFIMFDKLVTLIDNGNLSDTYYGRLLLRYLRQRYLMEKWQGLSEDKRTTENCLILLAEWFQPEELLLDSKIKSLLDDFAERVKESLKILFPEHSIFSVSNETLEKWKAERLLDNQFEAVESNQVFDCLLQAFKERTFKCKPLKIQEETTIIQRFSIDKVIETKRGWYYTLCVIFQSVARRLGLRSDILEAEFDSTLLPNDFEDELSILGWREKYLINNEGSYQDYLVANFMFPEIDVQNCHSKSLTIAEVSQHMIHEAAFNIFTQASRELETTLYPNVDTEEHYSCYLLDQFQLVDKNFKEKFLDTRPERNPGEFVEGYMYRKPEVDLVPRARNHKIQFYVVGSILYDIPSQGYYVVTGWEIGKLHIWYDVVQISKYETLDFFKHDENLLLVHEDTEQAMNAMELDEIGRYFTHFNGTRFVPNAKLASIYPEDLQQPEPSDLEVIKSLVKSIFKQNNTLSARLAKVENDVDILRDK